MRACGHPASELENTVLSCAYPTCGSEPTKSVLYVSPSLNDRACWRFAGTCDLHSEVVEAAATSEVAEHSQAGGVHRMPPSMPDVLDWIHSEGRCAVDCVSVVER